MRTQSLDRPLTRSCRSPQRADSSWRRTTTK
jgi:hypothetical protein